MDKEYYSLDKYYNDYNLSKKIIVNDIEAYINYPIYNKVYNKLWLCESQHIPCAPIGVYPKDFPIVFKPIYNLYGMSRSFYKINDFDEYDKYQQDGLFWMPYFPGTQINLDIIYDKDKIIFYSVLKSYPGENGTFKMHITEKMYTIPENIINWINTHLNGYRGALNLEIIDGTIIECHLRLNGDFHLYNKNFAEQLSNFYDGEEISFDYEIPEICIFPFFIYERDKNIILKLKNKISNLLLINKYVRTFYFDNIDSNYQSSYKKRALVFDCTNIQKALKIIEFIEHLINLEKN